MPPLPGYQNQKTNKDTTDVHQRSITKPITKALHGPVLQPVLLQNLQNTKDQSSGEKMPEQVQAKMEKGFGQDFSNVKIYPESDKAVTLGAKAFAQGSQIHFAPGAYNPETQDGLQLLGHELTHVVQQGAGRVKPTVQAKDIALNNDPVLEKEANDTGKLVSEGKSVHLPYSKSTALHSETQPVQRFEAPIHEGVGRVAMTSEGKFSNDEATLAYYGNWMRDMNQALVPALGDSLSPEIVFLIINFLGYKKFGRYMNAEQFGYYLPSEHMDNPGGQLPGTDYYNKPPTVSPDMQKDKDRFATSGWSARPDTLTTGQENNDPVSGSVLGANIFSVDQTGVLAYIRRTNLHVEKRLQYAAEKGRSPEGLMHFGAAMHAVEDLFAHSNYVEIAVDKILKDEPALLPELEPANRTVQKLTSTVNGRPVLTTGTFTSLDTLHSVGAEGVKLLREGLGDVKNDLEKAAQDGLMDKIVFSIDQNPALKKKVVDAVFGPLVPESNRESVLTQLYQVPLYEAYNKLKRILSAFNLFNLISLDEIKNNIRLHIDKNILKPASIEIEKKLLVTHVQDTPLYTSEQQIDEVIKSGGRMSNPLQEMTESITGEKLDTTAKLSEALRRKVLYDKTPSPIKAGPAHTQLAKDHTNSLFFGLAFRLAVEADKMLRNEMLGVWGDTPYVDPERKQLESDTAGLTPIEKNEHSFIALRKQKETQNLQWGTAVYHQGKVSGQQYDLWATRKTSADHLRGIARELSAVQNGLQKLSKTTQKAQEWGWGSTYIDPMAEQSRKIFDGALMEGHELKLDNIKQEFLGVADRVEKADTLEKREQVYRELLSLRTKYSDWEFSLRNDQSYGRMAIKAGLFGNLLIRIDHELAVVAPAYSTEQIKMLAVPGTSLKQQGLSLPSVMTGSKYKSVVEMARKIINHPYESDWWKIHVRNFMKTNGKQLAEEIRARNAGYAHFGGEHKH